MRNRLQFFNRHILISVVIANMITVTLYSINMVFLLNRPVFGSGFFMPFLVGSTGGYLFGLLYNQRQLKQKILYDAIEQQKILNSILLLSNQEPSLQKVLDQAILKVIEAPFTKIQSKGAIFVKEGQNLLKLKSHYKLSPELLNFCGKNGVAFGECLCGLAAEKKETIFKQCVDHDHTVKFPTMVDHGHYNVPIIFNDEVVGVIVVYLDANHKKLQSEIDFLESVANVLAIIINKNTVDKKAIQSESKLKEIQQFAGIGTWVLNLATQEIIASDEVYEIMGFKPQEFKYNETDFVEVTHPDDKEGIKRALVEAKNGIPFELETRHLKKDGSFAYIINKCKPKRLENGHISELSGTIVDVTQIRSKEAELFEKQGVVNGILSATPDPLFLIDLDSNEFTYYNSAMEAILIENPQFIIDYPKKGAALFREAVHPEDLAEYDKMNRVLRLSQDVFDIKFRTKIFGNGYHWVEQHVLVYSRKPSGKVHEVLVVSKDITDKVKADDRIVSLNNEMKIQFNSIKKVNKELDQFVYSVSHDLRAPLSSMLGLVNICNNDPDPNLLRECMNRMGTSIEKLDSFIKDILDYSRNARTDVANKAFKIEDLINELVDNIRLLGNPDIKLKLNIDEKVEFIGDRRRLSIILNNILSNACKYADPAKESRFVEIAIKTSSNGCFIEFKDNGIGIKQELINKVFDMFYRGTEASQGSGLGLYIVHETIQKLDGKINITSKEGIGTKIVISIPQATENKA